MKKFFYLLLIAVFLFSLTSCTLKNKSIGDEDDVQGGVDNISESDKSESSVQNITLEEVYSTGEIKYNDFYMDFYADDEIDWFDTDFDDLFKYKYNDKYGYADAEGNIVIKEQFDRAGKFSEGKAFVKKNGKWEIIDTAGNVLKTFSEEIEIKSEAYFKNGKAIFSHDYSFDGQPEVIIIIDEKYNVSSIELPSNTDIKIFNTPEFSGIAYSNWFTVDGRIYTLIDYTGKEIWKVKYNNIKYNEEAFMKEYCNALGRYACFSLNAMMINDGYMNIINEDGKWGLLDVKTGNVVLECKYDYVGIYSDGLLPVCSYGKWGYIDIQGNEVLKPSLNYTEAITNGRGLNFEDGSINLIEKNGNVICTYDINSTKKVYNISPFSKKKGLTFVGLDSDTYLLSSSGEVLASYDSGNLSVNITKNYIYAEGQMYKMVRK